MGFPQNPKGRGNPKLSSLNFMGSIDVSIEEQRRTGYAGVIGSLMLFTAIFAMAWASLDPTTDTRMLNATAFILIGGFVLSLASGFKLSRSKDLKSEPNAIMLGLGAGLIILVIQMVIMSLGVSFVVEQSVAFVFLAPVAETMMFVIAPYHFFRYNFPRSHWVTSVIPADIVFSVFHFYRYSAHPDFILILIILILGNTLFVWVYHITKNATAPILAHFIVNLASNTQPVLDYLYVNGPLFIIMFIFFAFLFTIVGDRRK